MTTLFEKHQRRWSRGSIVNSLKFVEIRTATTLSSTTRQKPLLPSPTDFLLKGAIQSGVAEGSAGLWPSVVPSNNLWRKTTVDCRVHRMKKMRTRTQIYFSLRKNHKSWNEGEFFSANHQWALTQLHRRDREWRSFQALVKLVPGLKHKISERSELLRTMYYTQARQFHSTHSTWRYSLYPSQLIDGANSARSDDHSRVTGDKMQFPHR